MATCSARTSACGDRPKVTTLAGVRAAIASDPVVVGVEHGHAVSRQRGRKLALGLRDPLQAAELAGVRVADAQHRAEPGRRNLAELGDVAETAR